MQRTNLTFTADFEARIKKMKVQLLSDLHVEHFRNLAAFQDAYENKFGNKLWENVSGIDVLVLAGDIASTTTYKEVMLECSKKFKHVMVVAGNHGRFELDWKIDPCQNSMEVNILNV